jgi:hypothetical protein
MERSLGGSQSPLLCQKFNETSKGQSGYCVRSPALWAELYSHHESHLLVAEVEGENVGYLILGLQPYLTARVASILEFCVWGGDEEACDALLSEAQHLAKQMNASALMTWESNQTDINQSLSSNGYFNIGRSVFSVGVTSLDFIKQVLESNNQEKPTATNGTHGSKDLLVDLGAKPFPAYTGTFVARVYPTGTVSVLDTETGAPYARLRTDTVTFCEVMLGQRSATVAVLSGGIKVKPATKTLAVAWILGKLSKCVDWYLPLGDHF